MTIEAEVHLTLDTGEVRVIEFDMPLSYQMGAVRTMIVEEGLNVRDVRELLITY